MDHRGRQDRGFGYDLGRSIVEAERRSAIDRSRRLHPAWRRGPNPPRSRVTYLPIRANPVES